MARASAFSTAIVAMLLSFGTAFPAEKPQAQKLREILDAPPPNPKEHSKNALAKIYMERSRAAAALGDVDRELTELNDGIQTVGPKDPASYDLHIRSSSIYLDKGDFVRGRTMREAALAMATTPGRKFFGLISLAGIASRLYDRQAGASYLSQADALFSLERRVNKDWSRFGAWWEAAINEARGVFNYTFGYLSQAESNFRSCATAIRAYLGKNPDAADSTYYYLPFCASRFVELGARLGHLREAGAYVNDVRETGKIYAQKQQREFFVTWMTRPVARVYLEQGLLKEAKSLLEATITQTQKADKGEASIWVADARYLLALSEMAQGNWQNADEMFRARRDGLRAHPEQADEVGTTVSEWGYALLRLGRLKEANEMLDANLKLREQRYDEPSLYLWEGRAFHALGVGAAGQPAAAVKTLSTAVPKILELGRAKGATETGYLTAARLGWILDGYIALLAELHRSGGRIEGIEPSAEAFRMADLARGSRVEKALSAAIIRASINDPQLAAVLRKAQDLEYQVKTTSESLAILQEGESKPEKEKLVNKTRAELERLRDENERAQAELKRKMPDYSELLDPKPLTIGEAQKLLRPQEALISLYSTQKQTLVWAVPAQGQASFHVADLPASKVSEIVAKLRKSLDPSEVDIGQVPTFDFTTAHELYQKLLAPVEGGWKNAKELIVVPHGALSELPFSVLVTGAYQPNKTGMPFADHATAPWLLKQAAISYLPSVAALATLRRGVTQPPERTFIGFGDPVFASASAPAAAPAALSSRGLVRRNLKARSTSSTAAESRPASSDLDLLQSLPDTAEEIREIAEILHADGARDLYLGRRASEQNVKSADLARYRIVMFATHGLIPGDLPDLNQPALALSNPTVTGEKEDGLLTLSEILGLKLRADWVVLSACNTASPDGQASEAVSGLGRAFFFAGAKALLVSHWPVETVSAKLLTTELFRRQANDSRLGRAQAVREASLAVMQQSAKPERGQPYSYAHPMFWAPFVVVGDGG
jgi:CHAT domain-containing protein